MIAYTFLVVLTLVVAYFEAKEDARHIGEHKPISHREQLRERFYMVGVITLLAMASSWLRDGILTPNWACLFMPAVAWAVFTTPFRWILNKKRGKDWRYCSPSNTYDRLFLSFFWWRKFKVMPTPDFPWIDAHRTDYPSSRKYREAVHNAGRAQYITETFILALSTGAYFKLQ